MASLFRAALFGAILEAGLTCTAVAAPDLSILTQWIGKEPFVKIVGGKSLWDQPAVQQAMRTAMGEQFYARARKTVLAGPQAPVTANGAGVVAAWSCKAHDCGDNQINAFFDTTDGMAQACLRLADRSGKVQDFWLANGKARPLAPDACLLGGSDPFVLLKKYGGKL